MKRSLTVLVVLPLLAATAHAATLEVGPGQRFAQPSEAIAVAQDGDTVAIHPGQYFDCAVVKQSNITIEGVGRGAVMTDKPCQGKALLVIDGDNVTVRNLTLQRARVPDANGAGIRAEGGNLTIESTRFLDNEDGILGADNPKATIRVLGSEFIGNGKCRGACAHAIYVGRFARLEILNTRFLGTLQGHNIKSRALVTRVANCDIEDGPSGSSSYLIDIPNGGTVVIEGNRMEKGPKSENRANTIMIGEEGVEQPTAQIIVRNNVMTNDTGYQTIFVHNITATPAQLSGNVFRGGPVRPLEGDGASS
jgi:hypothetical protein